MRTQSSAVDAHTVAILRCAHSRQRVQQVSGYAHATERRVCEHGRAQIHGPYQHRQHHHHQRFGTGEPLQRNDSCQRAQRLRLRIAKFGPILRNSKANACTCTLGCHPLTKYAVHVCQHSPPRPHIHHHHHCHHHHSPSTRKRRCYDGEKSPP